MKRTRRSGESVPTATPSARLPARAIRKDAEKRNQCLARKARKRDRGLFSARFTTIGSKYKARWGFYLAFSSVSPAFL